MVHIKGWRHALWVCAQFRIELRIPFGFLNLNCILIKVANRIEKCCSNVNINGWMDGWMDGIVQFNLNSHLIESDLINFWICLYQSCYLPSNNCMSLIFTKRSQMESEGSLSEQRTLYYGIQASKRQWALWAAFLISPDLRGHALTSSQRRCKYLESHHPSSGSGHGLGQRCLHARYVRAVRSEWVGFRFTPPEMLAYKGEVIKRL